jgi:hypothetical protein
MAYAPGGPARPNKRPSKGPPERHHLSQEPGRKERVAIAVVEEKYRVIQVKRPITNLKGPMILFLIISGRLQLIQLLCGLVTNNFEPENSRS